MAQVIEDSLFRLDGKSKRLIKLPETSYSELGIYETSDLHEWLADQIQVLGNDLMVIQREHVAVAETQRRPDIVALDGAGRIVVVEVKRSPAEGGAVWQSILYASYYSAYAASDVVDMYRDFAELDRAEAEAALLEHLDAEDLADLNSGQRIILVAPTFEPEVTNAALWLRDRNVDVFCVELRPYVDPDNESVFVHANVVIPLPSRADVGVTVRGARAAERQVIVGERRSRKGDEVSTFMEAVREAAFGNLDGHALPDRWSRWAGRNADGWRWYILWYDQSPWANHHFCFKVYKPDSDSDIGDEAEVEFFVWRKGAEDQGATAEEIDRARDLAIAMGKRSDWEFSEPAQKKSFRIVKYITGPDSNDHSAVGSALSDLIEEFASKFSTMAEEDDD